MVLSSWREGLESAFGGLRARKARNVGSQNQQRADQDRCQVRMKIERGADFSLEVRPRTDDLNRIERGKRFSLMTRLT